MAAIVLLSALFELTFNGTLGTLGIVTSLDWPFRLNFSTLENLPSGFNSTLLDGEIGCANLTGEACTQLFRLQLLPVGACSLTGTYVFNFSLDCRGNEDCHFDWTNSTAVLNISVVTPSFCSPADFATTLTGSLDTFADSAFQSHQTRFIQNQTAYFRITLDTNNMAVILSSDIVEVRVSAGHSLTAVLRQNDSNTVQGNQVSLASAIVDPYYPTFDFTLSDAVFPVLADLSATFTISTVINVSYTHGRRRSVDSLSTALAANVFIGRANPTPTNPTNSHGPSPSSGARRPDLYILI